MKRTTDEMIYILSEYAAAHRDEIQTFDDLTPYIAKHPEIFGKKGEDVSESYKAFYEGENTLNEEEAKAHFKKAIELDPLNFDARSELLALESKNSNEYAAKGLDIQTKGLDLFTKDENYKSYIGKFFETTTTASFLRFTKSLMEQFYMAGEYQIAVSLGKEMLMLDIKDNYKARRILFKALVGLGDDIAIREFIDDYCFAKDSYFYATLGLYKLNKGYTIEAFNILNDWSNEMKQAKQDGKLRIIKEPADIEWMSTKTKNDKTESILADANTFALKYCFGKLSSIDAYKAEFNKDVAWGRILNEINEKLGK